MNKFILKLFFLFCLIFSFFACEKDENINSDFEIFNSNIEDFDSFNNNNNDKILKNLVFQSSDIISKPYTIAPVVIITNSGNILAASHKVGEHSDKGEMEVILAISIDGGISFKNSILFKYDHINGRKMSPSFVIDRIGAHGVKGRVYCFVQSIKDNDKYAHEVERRGDANCLYRYSDDNGITWSEEFELLNKIPSQYLLFGPSPANGIQIKNGTLIIPAFVFNKDFGVTYKTGIIFKTPKGDWEFSCIDELNNNESTIVASDNHIILNVRNQSYYSRRIYYSNEITDNMKGQDVIWQKHVSDQKFLVQTICQGSLEKITIDTDIYYLFSNPRSTERNYICIWVSRDLLHWKPIYYLTMTPSGGYSNLNYYNNKLLAIYESDIIRQECEIQDLSPLLRKIKLLLID
jgi:hypothetical protein